MITFDEIKLQTMNSPYELEIQVKSGIPVQVLKYYSHEGISIESFDPRKFLIDLREVKYNLTITALDDGLKYIQEIYIDTIIYKRTETGNYRSKFDIIKEFLDYMEDGDVEVENDFWEAVPKEYVVKIEPCIFKSSIEDILSEIQVPKYFETRFINDIFYKN